jgi:hypothetical protein
MLPITHHTLHTTHRTLHATLHTLHATYYILHTIRTHYILHTAHYTPHTTSCMLHVTYSKIVIVLFLASQDPVPLGPNARNSKVKITVKARIPGYCCKINRNSHVFCFRFLKRIWQRTS